jgi:dihydropteroate synthase
MLNLNVKGILWNSVDPVVMGIINCTPDSFFEGSRANNYKDIVAKAGEMLEQGASILDIGGQSSRPGSDMVGVETELSRVLPAIKAIKDKFPDALLSIDSFHSIVAEKALEAGASIINDISAGVDDPEIYAVAASYSAPYICMHMQGRPSTMQQNPSYQNVVTEILDFFIERKEVCIAAGIKDIIIDPGFGFGKSIEHNFTLLSQLNAFSILSLPILAGLSRKSMIYKTLGTTAEFALNGTTALNMIALQNGASLLRVHDVKEALEVIQLFKSIKKA